MPVAYRSNLPARPERMARRPLDERGAKRRHPLYHLWKAMVRRCHCERDIGYRKYGARGIAVCERWRQDFWAFVEDIPQRPSPEYTIDRIDGRKGYAPGNVRWATRNEQNRNMRSNRHLTVDGDTKILDDWAIESGIPKTTIFNRLQRGWNDQDAVTAPAQAKAPDNSLFPRGGRQVCAARGLNPYTVASRLRRGWSFEQAIATPVAPQKGGRGNARS
jgi:hypothetical protein